MLNFVFGDEELKALYLNWMSTRESGNKSAKVWARERLGRHSYCWTGYVRHWVWERKQWRLYASVEGLSLEVIMPLDRPPIEVMQNFLSEWNFEVPPQQSVTSV